MKKNGKVGILTQYYKSHNYGGLLQAYALTTVLKKIGYDVEQVCYLDNADDYKNIKDESIKIEKASKKGKLLRKLVRFTLDSSIKKRIGERFNKMDCFAEDIPHSKDVYHKDNYHTLVYKYCQFIVGSDQVWNPKFYAPIYFCDFAKDEDINCISYAASVAQKNLSDSQRILYSEHMKNFSAISLRENNLEIIQSLTDKKVEWVLDPTLLLSNEEWSEISSNRLVHEKYVFCYFLGNDRIERELAKKFAKYKKCKLVTIPHLSGIFEKSDIGFGDVQITSASPQDFISLVQHADFVFTDSFHACVFSQIFKTKFFVFQRVGHGGMSTRIDTLLSMFDTEKYFCKDSERQSMDYLLNNSEGDFSINTSNYEVMKSKSIEFLKTNLK